MPKNLTEVYLAIRAPEEEGPYKILGIRTTRAEACVLCTGYNDMVATFTEGADIWANVHYPNADPEEVIKLALEEGCDDPWCTTCYPTQDVDE